MNKINGYTEEEAENLVEYIFEGKQEGKTLSYLFETYGKSHGRAKGSVRNYYYQLLKCRSDERVEKMLAGKNLYAESIREFTEEETDEILSRILSERKKGLSVRRAIFNVAGGDEKLRLRLQNKYRNLVKKQPERVKRIGKEVGLAMPLLPSESAALKNKVEQEIAGVYKMLYHSLKEENERLSQENAALKEGFSSFLAEGE